MTSARRVLIRTLDGATAWAEIHNAGPGPDRARIRFFLGLADAMADQWGGWAMEQEAAA